MPAVPCTEYIRMLETQVANERAAVRWHIGHLQEEIKELRHELADKNATIGELEAQLEKAQAFIERDIPKSEPPPASAPMRPKPHQSVIKIICEHLLPSSRRRAHEAEEELG